MRKNKAKDLEVPKVLIDTWWNVNKTEDTKNCKWCKF